VPVRAALYLRVSTGRQAANDVSIPDQRRQARAYCTSRGWEICGLKADSALWRFEGAALIQVDEQREARKDQHHHKLGHHRQ